MTTILKGWLGYGTAVQAGVLSEPTDPAYTRRALVLGDLNNGHVNDLGSGTIGPAGIGWGTIGFLGIYDAQSAGNLLLWIPLNTPIVIGAGATISTQGGALQFLFADLRNANGMQSWPGGVVVGTTPDGRLVSSGVALQFSGGSLAAQTTTFGTTIVMASLPQSQPTSGSGQLWNNGGVISVA